MIIRSQDVQIRPAFIYVYSVRDRVEAIRKLLNESSIKVPAVKNALDSLSRTLQDSDKNAKLGVIPDLKEYEDGRELPVGETKRRALNEANEAVEKYQKEIDSIAKKHEEAMKKLNRERDSLVKNTNAEVWEKIIADNDERQKRRDKYLNLSEQRRNLEKTQDEIEQRACCGCMGKKDKKLFAKNKADLAAVYSSIETIMPEVEDDPGVDKEYADAKANKSRFEFKLQEKDNAITQEIENNKESDTTAREKLSKAKDTQISLSEEIVAEGIGFCKNLSQNMMFNMVHLRARVSWFMDILCKAAEEASPAQGVLLDAIQSRMLNINELLDKKLKGLSCDEAGSRTGLNLYQGYLALTKTNNQLKQQFENSEYSPDKLLATIVPLKLKPVVNLRNSANDINSFFPSDKKFTMLSPTNVSSSVSSMGARK